MAKLSVTFGSDTEGKGRSAHIDEGEYGFKVIKAELGRSPEKKTKQAIATLQVIKDPMHKNKYKGKKIRFTMNLLPQSLWVLRAFLEAIGIKVKSGSKLNIDTTKWVGKELGGTVEDDEYKRDGKTRVSSKVVETYPIDELDARTAGTAQELDDEEEEDDDEEDEEETDDEDEEEDEDEEDEEDEDEDEEEAEEEVKPKKKSSKAKPKAKVKKGKKSDDDDDELEGIDLDDV